MSALLSKQNVVNSTIAVAGMIVGAIVGIGVQVGIESTGVLGPSVESLFAAQQNNFDDLKSRLDRIRMSTDDPELSLELTELAALLQQQDELRQEANAELTYLGDQVVSLREQRLADQGFSGGADFWLKTGESVSVGDRRNVLGVYRMWDTAVDITLNGKKSRLTVGDQVSTEKCTVFFKQAGGRPDGRMGFDLVCD